LRPIEIIGGGLAGLSLGLALRRAGVAVALSEAGAYPRHRVCGEFISGLSAETIAKLGLAPFLHDALRHHEVMWFMNGRPARTQTLPSPALALSRHRLDGRLADAFVAAGGQLNVNTRVAALHADSGRVFATGRDRSPARWLGLKIHACNLPLHCDLELHLGADAYVGLTRVEEGRVNVCGLFRRRALQAKGVDLLLAYLRESELSVLAGRLAQADADGGSFSAVAAVGFNRRVAANDRVVIGDACAVTPPFTGNGMAMALQSAEAALAPLVAYSHGVTGWDEARRAIHASLQSRFRLRLAVAELLHPFLLQRGRQRWLHGLAQAHLLPFRPLYSVLH